MHTFLLMRLLAWAHLLGVPPETLLSGPEASSAAALQLLWLQASSQGLHAVTRFGQLHCASHSGSTHCEFSTKGRNLDDAQRKSHTAQQMQAHSPKSEIKIVRKMVPCSAPACWTRSAAYVAAFMHALYMTASMASASSALAKLDPWTLISSSATNCRLNEDAHLLTRLDYLTSSCMPHIWSTAAACT